MKAQRIKVDPVFYPAKVLLFGEYTVINGGSALAQPLPKYGGQWSMQNKDPGLLSFFEHLLEIAGVLPNEVQKAISGNWTFESNIPIGYGIGSSGALTAAAYDQFFEKEIHSYDLLKDKLAEIEGYFHGISSGMDPLTSFVSSPILVKKKEITVLEALPINSKLFLYDSQIRRTSKPLIDYYKNQMASSSSFGDAVFALGRFTERVILEVVSGEDFSKGFKEISQIQFDAFNHMIPESIRPIWKTGLVDDRYYMKLSGAGGGGYFLVHKIDPNCSLKLESLT